ncbi:response regulator [Flavimarina sp. Hel_I_48]|uniref:response regulator n=1 Tax=Flavimarina sp. Hel_I_48 TaxID=1392488 RepID=UPI00068E3DAF|nr:response regulator [Flavimarina sp. Hel_I_48]
MELRENFTDINLFLVDDQKITNFINMKIITMADICKNIHCYINPLQALEEIEEKNPQFVLLDLNMPEIDGWEFLERLQTYKTDTKVIILTSSTNNEDVQRAKTYNSVINYLIKPLDEKALKNALNLSEISKSA